MDNNDNFIPLLAQSVKTILIPSFWGSLLSILMWNDKVTWKFATASLIAGSGFAYWGTELVVSRFHLEPGANGMISFLVGIAGLQITRGVIQGAKALADNPLRFFKGPKP